MFVLRLLLLIVAAFVAVALLKVVLVVALVGAVVVTALFALTFVRRLIIKQTRPYARPRRLRRVEPLAKTSVSIR